VHRLVGSPSSGKLWAFRECGRDHDKRQEPQGNRAQPLRRSPLPLVYRRTRDIAASPEVPARAGVGRRSLRQLARRPFSPPAQARPPDLRVNRPPRAQATANTGSRRPEIPHILTTVPRARATSTPTCDFLHMDCAVPVQNRYTCFSAVESPSTTSTSSARLPSRWPQIAQRVRNLLMNHRSDDFRFLIRDRVDSSPASASTS
jgi:hypothetical protein